MGEREGGHTGMTSLYIEEKINKVKKVQRYFCSPYLLHRFQMDLHSLIHKNKIKLIIHESGVNTCMQALATYAAYI